MKNTYYVITHHLNGKYFCEIMKLNEGVNLMGVIKEYNAWNTIECLSACESRKEAESLTNFWNDCFRTNKTYAVIARGEIYS